MHRKKNLQGLPAWGVTQRPWLTGTQVHCSRGKRKGNLPEGTQVPRDSFHETAHSAATHASLATPGGLIRQIGGGGVRKCSKKEITCTAAAAKLLQSCPPLWDPIDGSPPGSPVPGILQARTLEWVAISFSNAGK